MVDLQTCRAVRERFETASWALWSDRFPKRGCVEEDPAELVQFIEDNRHRLKRDVVFLGLNPSTDSQEEEEGMYTNFHSPKLQHRDVDLRIVIEENDLEGAYMTDVTTKPTPDSGEISDEDIDIDDLIEQFEILDRDAFDIVCFGRRVFNLLKGRWSIPHEELKHNIWSFSSPVDQVDADFYSVYHYSQPDGRYTDKLRIQLRYLQSTELL